MNNEFVTYEQALALKELGFDEEYFGYYLADTLFITNDVVYNSKEIPVINAPLKQQVFRWFREKYGWYANIMSWIHEEEIGIYHEFEIYGTPNSAHGSISFKTYNEAENNCIDKLLEIATKN
jgi:hypothetical protein